MLNTHLTNDELKKVYTYLTDAFPQKALAKDLGRTRTNTYYYIGRAAHYWIRTGVLRFRKIKDMSELGGKDIVKKEPPEEKK